MDEPTLVEVVGESHYQDALDRICGGRCADGHNVDTPAVITGEPENPYDPNAIQVRIREELIGYLPRQAAAVVAPRLASRPGRRYEVDAVITGGWDRGSGDVGHYGVRVYLPPPDYI